MHRHGHRIILPLLFALAGGCDGPGGDPPPPGPPPIVAWEATSMPITTLGAAHKVDGELCRDTRVASPVLILALHGASYNRAIWKIQPPGLSASMMGYFCARGRAVLAVDLLGTGKSSKPSGDQLSLPVQADVVVQLLEQLRRSGRWSKLVLMGHSQGAAIATIASKGQLRHDGLIMLSFVHEPHAPPVPPQLLQELMMQGASIDYQKPPGSPAFRASLFYAAGGADLTAPDVDNAQLADVTPRSSLMGMISLFGDPSATGSVTVSGPVLQLVGDRDVLYPGSLSAKEASYYPKAMHTSWVMRDTGHTLPMHDTAPEAWDTAQQWIQAFVVEGRP